MGKSAKMRLHESAFIRKVETYSFLLFANTIRALSICVWLVYANINQHWRFQTIKINEVYDWTLKIHSVSVIRTIFVDFLRIKFWTGKYCLIYWLFKLITHFGLWTKTTARLISILSNHSDLFCSQSFGWLKVSGKNEI